MTNKTKYLFFDESGNLGKDGRYFVIACIESEKYKRLDRVMKKTLLKVKNKFPNQKYGSNELKASSSNPVSKDFILNKICREDLLIHYIAVDLKHVRPDLLKDKNLLYNYVTKILLTRIIKKEFNYSIMCDNHTTKVTSTNSLSDYIKVHFNYEKNLNIKIDFEFIDSDSKNGYVIQAADFIANAVYNYYEYNNEYFYYHVRKRIGCKENFPKNKFSK